MRNNKPSILLDLDQTLISAEYPNEINHGKYKDKEKKIRHDDMYDGDEHIYTVYSRPNLQKFLDYLFKNFNVTIWTAASKDYALFIIDKIVLNNQPERKLDFIFFSYHCDISKKTKKYSKELCTLWDIHKIPGYSYQNTIILDDYKADVHKCQPNNCIIAPPFNFTKEDSEKDTFLIDLIPELDKMKKRIEDGDEDITNSVNLKMKTVK